MKKFLTFLGSMLLCVSLAAQDAYEIKGVISDNLGPVMGVAVLEQGTTNGVQTDFDGNFALSVSSPEAIVEVSCIGYRTLTFKASEVPEAIMLEEDSQLLEDVVVIGYGSQKKKEVTGAVASVKPEDFNPGVKANPIGLLQGKVAGLNIIRTTSDPTQTGFNVQIRGFSTLDKGAGTSPLYIVDGVPVSGIDQIAPDEIASMDVLKDGSAAAIYGTRGTNGVIIITTKRGGNFSKEAKTHVEYAGYASASVSNGKTGMATPEQFRNLSELSGGKVAPVIYDDGTGNAYNTDWMDEMTRDVALAHNHNVAIVGSASNFNYRASINYKDAQGIAEVSNRNEYIAKLSAGQKALDGWLDLQYDMSYMHYRNDYNCGDFKQAAILNPTFPITDPTTVSGYYRPDGTGQSNPLEAMNQKESYGDGNYFRGSIKATVNILPVKGLKVSAFGAIEEGDNHSYWANRTLAGDEAGSGKSGRNSSTNYNRLFEATSDYSRSFGKHNIAGVLGFSWQEFMYDGESISNKGFPTESMKYYQIGNGDASKKYLSVSSSRNSNVLAAVFARANYNYAEKYLLSLSLRREGSSRFGANHKWGWFPAVSAGWRISGEDFMKNSSRVDDLKLRAGFGVTGNNLATDLRSVAMLSNGGSFWLNGQYVYTYGVSQNVNPDLRWEKKFEYNLGVDYSFFDERLYGSLDLYFRNTRDLLWDYEVPTPPYQFNTLLANAGQMISYGAELIVSYVPIKTENFMWTTTPTLSYNHNIITKLSDPSKGFNYKQTTSGGVGENGIMNTTTQILIEGQPVGAFYGYEFAGFKEDGTWMFRTPEGGYKQDANLTEADRQVIGNAQPWFTFGWNNSIRWKNWDFSAFMRGVVGNKILNLTRWAYGPQASQSLNVFMKDISEGNVVYTNKTHFASYYLEDGSYLKLDNLTVGYTLPVKDNKFVSSLRVYASGQNLFTLTAYSGMDPEVNTTGVWDAGIDYTDFYPTVATMLIGVNVTFK